LTDKIVKAAEDNTNNVSSVSNVGGNGKIAGYDSLIPDLQKMSKDFMDSIESKVTTKLEEVAKRVEEVQRELRKHEEEAKDTSIEDTTGAPYKRKPAGTRLEETRREESKREEELARREEEVARREEEMTHREEEARKHEAKVVYRPIFVSPSKKAAATMSEEEVNKRRADRAKKLEEIKRSMEDKRKKLAYEASKQPVAQGKAQTVSTTDTPTLADANASVPMPGAPNVQIPAWMADVMKNFKKSEAGATFQG